MKMMMRMTTRRRRAVNQNPSTKPRAPIAPSLQRVPPCLAPSGDVPEWCWLETRKSDTKTESACVCGVHNIIDGTTDVVNGERHKSGSDAQLCFDRAPDAPDMATCPMTPNDTRKEDRKQESSGQATQELLGRAVQQGQAQASTVSR